MKIARRSLNVAARFDSFSRREDDDPLEEGERRWKNLIKETGHVSRNNGTAPRSFAVKTGETILSPWSKAARRDIYEVEKRAAFTTALAADDENSVQLGNNRHETGFYVITLPRIVRTIALLFMGQRDRFSNDDLRVIRVVFTTGNLWKGNRC